MPACSLLLGISGEISVQPHILITNFIVHSPLSYCTKIDKITLLYQIQNISNLKKKNYLQNYYNRGKK